MNKLRKYFSLPAWQRIIILKASVLLPICQIAIQLLSFKTILKLYKLNPTSGSGPNYHREILSNPHVAKIASNIEKTAVHIPLIRVRCLAISLTTITLLGSLNKHCTLHLGANYNRLEKDMSAHAWLTFENVIISGEIESKSYSHSIRFSVGKSD